MICLLLQTIGIMISCVCKNPDIHWYKWDSLNVNFFDKDKHNAISNTVNKNNFALRVQIIQEKTSNNFKFPSFFIQNSYAFIDCDNYTYYTDTLKDIKITSNIPWNSNYNSNDNLKDLFKASVYTTTGFYEQITIEELLSFTQKYSGKFFDMIDFFPNSEQLNSGNFKFNIEFIFTNNKSINATTELININ